MRVNVADIRLESGAHKTVPVQVAIDSIDPSGEEAQFERPFTGEVEIWNVGDRLLVRGSLSGEAQVQCVRCLGPATLPLEIEFEEEFIQSQPFDQKETDEDEGEVVNPRSVTYYEGDEIDLSETVRDHALLELPMQPLCRTKCEGLCPTCGANRNEGPCSCTETTSVDPRLSVLQNLLRKPDSNS